MDPDQFFAEAQAQFDLIDVEQMPPEALSVAYSMLAMAGYLKQIAQEIVL